MMHVIYIFMNHIHHIVPKHLGGTDDSYNLAEMSVLDHAIAHLVLHRMFGRDEDAIAARGLFKQAGIIASTPGITEEWAEKARMGYENISPEKKAEMRKKQSLALRGNTNGRGNKGKKRPPYSPLYPFCQREGCKNRIKSRPDRRKFCSNSCSLKHRHSQ